MEDGRLQMTEGSEAKRMLVATTDLAALATAKITRRRTPRNFKTGSRVPNLGNKWRLVELVLPIWKETGTHLLEV